MAQTLSEAGSQESAAEGMLLVRCMIAGSVAPWYCTGAPSRINLAHQSDHLSLCPTHRSTDLGQGLLAAFQFLYPSPLNYSPHEGTICVWMLHVR